METGTEKPYRDLTLRETDIIDLVANGFSNREIARELVITEDTVKTHIYRTLRKLKANNRGHAAVLALKHEIISLDDIDIPDTCKDETVELIHAPWTPEQVDALNQCQERGRIHPFTCGALHSTGRSPVLEATRSGWQCPDPACTYHQDWAHAFMADPALWTV